jgi:hypothetical protein
MAAELVLNEPPVVTLSAVADGSCRVVLELEMSPAGPCLFHVSANVPDGHR